jgi:hypothetical protein
MGTKGRENGPETDRHDKRKREARRHCDNDSGLRQGRDKTLVCHVLP